MKTFAKFSKEFPNISKDAVIMTRMEYYRESRKLLKLEGALREAGGIAITIQNRKNCTAETACKIARKRYDILRERVSKLQGSLSTALIAMPPQ